MDIIKIGEPIITRMGTVVTRYVENGRLYKSIDFEKSANKYARQNGLVKTVVRYGERNKPETVYDTFERQIIRNTEKPTEGIKVAPSTRGRKKGSGKTPKPTTPKSKAETPTVEPKETPAIPKPVETKPTEPVDLEPKKVTTSEDNTPKLIPISADSFTGETTKKLFKKIQKYVKLAGLNGSIKDAKIMSEEGYSAGRDSTYSQIKKSADIVLSVNRIDGDLHLTLGRNNLDNSRNFTLFDVLFDKNGQMKEGKLPLERISFNRYGANVRRLKKQGMQFLPVGENDREWSNTAGTIISPSSDSNIWYSKEDNAVGGAFEIFMELARLHTSIFK